MKRSILILPFLFLGCAMSKDRSSKPHEITNSLVIVQGENRMEIKNPDTTVSLSKAPFSLEFKCRKYDGENKMFYSARIATTTNKEEFEKVNNGPLQKNHPFFGFATGLAADNKEGYGTMYVQNDGHHYLFYSSEDYKRATLVEDLNDETVHLRWTINTVTLNGETDSLESTELEYLYMLYYQDVNLNDTIELGELKKIQLNLQ